MGIRSGVVGTEYGSFTEAVKKGRKGKGWQWFFYLEDKEFESKQISKKWLHLLTLICISSRYYIINLFDNKINKSVIIKKIKYLNTI